MDHSVPLWEVHVLDFPTAEAAAALALRVHHSVGDGVSMLSLFMACTRSAADPGALPTLPPARRAGPVHAVRRRRRPPPSSPAGAFLDALAALAAWVVAFLVLAWHTVVDVARFVATAASLLGDAPTVLKAQEGTEFRPKRFVNRTLSLDDIKFVKNAMSCVRTSFFSSWPLLLYSAFMFFFFKDRRITDKFCSNIYTHLFRL